MTWDAIPLGGSKVYVTVDTDTNLVHILPDGDPFNFSTEGCEAIQFAERINRFGTPSHSTAGGGTWRFKGGPHDSYLYLLDPQGDHVGMIRIAYRRDGLTKIRISHGPHAKLASRGKHTGLTLLDELRKLVDELTGAQVH